MKRIIIILLCSLFVNLLFSQVENPFLRGIAQLELEEYSSAIASFTLAIDNNIYTPKSFFYKGVALTKVSKYRKAEESFMQAKSLGYNDADLWIAKIHAQNVNSAQAISYLNRYLKENNTYNSSEIIKDEAFQAIHQTSEWQEFVLNIHASPIEELIYQVAYIEKNEQYTEGIDLINSALLEYKQAPELLFYRANLYLKGNNLPLATIDAIAALSKEPENNKYLALLAEIYMRNLKYENAIEIYNKLIHVIPEYLDNYLRLALAYSKLNQNENARIALNTYLRYISNNVDARYLSAEIYYNQKQFTKSILELNELIKNHIPRAEWFLKRGMCFMQTATYKSAAEDLSMCIDLDPSNSAANLQLGIAHQRIGNASKACFYWEKALLYGELKATEYILQYCN